MALTCLLGEQPLASGCAQVISDLLKPERQNLTIKEDRRRGVFVDGLSEWVVRSPHEARGLELGPPLHAEPALDLLGSHLADGLAKVDLTVEKHSLGHRSKQRQYEGRGGR